MKLTCACLLAASLFALGQVADKSEQKAAELAGQQERDELMQRMPPDTKETDWQGAVDLALRVRTSEPAPFRRTQHSAAQWFPNAGFGLFMHWGIHSVKGVQPSWAMIKDYPAGGVPEMYPPERYYAYKKDFNPQNYDPDLWMEATAKAGFTYAVLTTKHHDGYALWPTAYGDLSTRQYMGGRDLLEPYVAACRKHGLKVGFYFSPRDWHYPGYPVEFDYNKRDQARPAVDLRKNQLDFEAFYAYTIGQLNELLTRYGTIDLLWFDGMGWDGIPDVYALQTLAWIRSLQPGIVINDRWSGMGDYKTPEWDLPEGPPSGWWENCIAWNGHWGYNPNGIFHPSKWALERLTRARAWGGNLLLNVGPAPDGTMPLGFYERCGEVAQWMAWGRDSLIGAGLSPGDDRANVPITTRGDTWYLHVPPEHEGPVELRFVAEPASVTLLRTGEPLPSSHKDGVLAVDTAGMKKETTSEVLVVTWPESKWEKDIRAFEEQDKTLGDKRRDVVFLGSSSIRMWNLAKFMPGLSALNRGFGGSQYDAAALYADRILLPHCPRAVVLYSGDNDIAGGRSPEWVLADFQYLIRRIEYMLPDARIFVLSIKPSVARWAMWDKMRQTNELFAAFADKDDHVDYIDVATPILGPDGKPRADLLMGDGLHLNDKGYEIWSSIVRPLIDASLT